MSKLGVEGLAAERADALAIFESLTDSEWKLPSDCAGWKVRDVLAHMGSTLHGVIDPAFMPDLSGGTEPSMEGPVAERRDWTIAQVLDEYASFSEQVAALAASAQDPPLAETMLPMGDLGTHPMAMMPDLFLFDVYCHLRNDILAPNGPIDRAEPPRDESRLRPTVEWMIAGLPWMCRDALVDIVDRPLTLELDGLGGGTWTITPGDDTTEGRVRVSDGAASDAAATARSTDHDFVVWGTQRRPWRGFVKVGGDDDYAAEILDRVKII